MLRARHNTTSAASRLPPRPTGLPRAVRAPAARGPHLRPRGGGGPRIRRRRRLRSCQRLQFVEADVPSPALARGDGPAVADQLAAQVAGLDDDHIAGVIRLPRASVDELDKGVGRQRSRKRVSKSIYKPTLNGAELKLLQRFNRRRRSDLLPAARTEYRHAIEVLSSGSGDRACHVGTTSDVRGAPPSPGQARGGGGK